jgi:hypothetical protein
MLLGVAGAGGAVTAAGVAGGDVAIAVVGGAGVLTAGGGLTTGGGSTLGGFFGAGGSIGEGGLTDGGRQFPIIWLLKSALKALSRVSSARDELVATPLPRRSAGPANSGVSSVTQADLVDLHGAVAVCACAPAARLTSNAPARAAILDERRTTLRLPPT